MADARAGAQGAAIAAPLTPIPRAPPPPALQARPWRPTHSRPSRPLAAGRTSPRARSRLELPAPLQSEAAEARVRVRGPASAPLPGDGEEARPHVVEQVARAGAELQRLPERLGLRVGQVALVRAGMGLGSLPSGLVLDGGVVRALHQALEGPLRGGLDVAGDQLLRHLRHLRYLRHLRQLRRRRRLRGALQAGPPGPAARAGGLQRGLLGGRRRRGLLLLRGGPRLLLGALLGALGDLRGGLPLLRGLRRLLDHLPDPLVDFAELVALERRPVREALRLPVVVAGGTLLLLHAFQRQHEAAGGALQEHAQRLQALGRELPVLHVIDELGVRLVVRLLRRRLHELGGLLGRQDLLLRQEAEDGALLGRAGEGAVRVPLRRRPPRGVAVAERRGELALVPPQPLGVGEGEAAVAEALLRLRAGLVGPPDAEPDQSEAVALEGLHGVAAVPVEEHQLLLDVRAERVGRRAALLCGPPSLVVVAPVVQLAAGEVAEGGDEARALVVPVPVQLRRVAPVDVDGGKGEALLVVAHLLREVVLQPAAHELRHLRVVLRGVVDQDAAVVGAQEAQGVAVNELGALGHHVLPRGVLLPGPELQHVVQVGVGDGQRASVGLLEDELRHDLRLHALGVHLDADAAHLAARQVAAVDAEAVGHLEGLRPGDPLPVHGGQDLVRLVPRLVPVLLPGAH
mmetsp:Transcript_48205/g.142259  ORF Transcript_48205/g.142259 Transcript_48205/m.142259 type:complete len:686 (-) Transcript_48205:303-2360(-)